jgi:hypothetical protein
MYQPSMKPRMDNLERQEAEITARQLEAPADIPDVHPNIANLYRRRVERLTEALNDPDRGRQAAEALRSLIGEISSLPARSVVRFTPSYAVSCSGFSTSSGVRKVDVLAKLCLR